MGRRANCNRVHRSSSSKPEFGKLFQKVGYNVEHYSIGKYAELFSLDRPFTTEEREFFTRGVMTAYEDFIKKVAFSRGIPADELNKVAKGRVWTGKEGIEKKIV